MGIYQVLRWNAFHQLHLHLIRCFAFRQPCAVAHAKDVCVHCHGGFAKRHIQHHVGRFAAHAGQGFECFTCAGYHARVLVHQDAAGLHQVFGFTAVKANGLDVALQAFQVKVQNLLRRVGYRKQAPRGLVHTHIGGLGTQQHSG